MVENPKTKLLDGSLVCASFVVTSSSYAMDPCLIKDSSHLKWVSTVQIFNQAKRSKANYWSPGCSSPSSCMAHTESAVLCWVRVIQLLQLHEVGSCFQVWCLRWCWIWTFLVPLAGGAASGRGGGLLSGGSTVPGTVWHGSSCPHGSLRSEGSSCPSSSPDVKEAEL